MGTVTISASGFTTLPSTPPNGWPATVTWPGGGNPNGATTWTINDTDWQQVLSWIAWSQIASGSPTAAQILLAWVNYWKIVIQQSVQQYYTTPPAVPPPISMG